MDNKKWLDTLTLKQLAALASQRNMSWKTESRSKLITKLRDIEDIQEPVRG